MELTVQGVSINVSCTHLMETKKGKHDDAAADLLYMIPFYFPKLILPQPVLDYSFQ